MDDTRPIPGQPLYNPHSGQTELETQLLESTDPALLRLHLRRLSADVAKLLDREARRVAPPEPDEPGEPTALEKRVVHLEARDRARHLGTLVVAACLVAWAGACTALTAGSFVWAVTR